MIAFLGWLLKVVTLAAGIVRAAREVRDAWAWPEGGGLVPAA